MTAISILFLERLENQSDAGIYIQFLVCMDYPNIFLLDEC
jgi:hypothetical protein